MNFWRNRELREHISVIDGQIEPHLILKNGNYLNVFLNQWIQANIWIYQDRIIYIGKKLPENLQSTEVMDCTGKYIVPGYIEPHAHPFQLYNPETLAYHAAKTGTTTLVNDTIMWIFLVNREKAFTIIRELDTLPFSFYWWGRFDSQTVLQDEQAFFNTDEVLSWLKHPSVIQGGELSSWPKLLDGDDRLLYWIQEAKRLGKPIEGHFPGASLETLLKMKLLGIHSDHEAMTGEEVLNRLKMGYQVSLRHSSIRPDLPNLIREILELGLTNFSKLTFTTDGSTPIFYEEGLINQCILLTINHGIPIIEAYKMASYNAARHLRIDNDLGSIAPGKIAHLNILSAKDNPHPESVLAKGEWIVKDQQQMPKRSQMNWEKNGVIPLSISWALKMDDLQFSSPIGLELVNEVIVKAKPNRLDLTLDQLPKDEDTAFLLLIDKKGKWRSNTTLSGFTKSLGGLASSYSPSGDHIVIGKNKYDMLLAWKKMKEIGGGIVLVHQGKVIYKLPLPLGGLMSLETMEELIRKEEELYNHLKEHGYLYEDPIFTIYFLASTNLPYIRITQKGIYDVMKETVLFPATMR